MSALLIVDAHAHTGEPGTFYAPEHRADQLLARMDQLGIARAICMDQRAIYEPAAHSLDSDRHAFERSNGRIHYLAVFDPRCAAHCERAIRQARDRPGLAGLKFHPSMHGVRADDPGYETGWQLAAELRLPVMTHSWSVSSYNPVQALSTPGRFERYAKEFPAVPLVLGHAGGRGTGRAEAVRLARQYPNVHLDFAGDIFCFRLIEDLVAAVSPQKILFGTDYPWFDPRAHLTRVLLAEIPADAKRMILGENARRVYGVG